MRCVILLWIGLLIPLTVRGQAGRVLLLETNAPEAMVYADTLWLGPASRHTFVLPQGAATLRLVPPVIGSWTLEPRVVDLTAYPGVDTLRLAVPFAYHYRIESLPSGAPVYLEVEGRRQLVGRTPLTYRSEEPIRYAFVLDRPGYQQVTLTPGDDLWNRHMVVLKPVMSLPGTQPDAQVNWRPPRQHRAWIDYAAVGTALAAGVLAVHFKMKADRRFDRYQQTGDPALRPVIERYDLYSGIALGVSQVGLGLFAIRLILR